MQTYCSGHVFFFRCRTPVGGAILLHSSCWPSAGADEGLERRWLWQRRRGVGRGGDAHPAGCGGREPAPAKAPIHGFVWWPCPCHARYEHVFWFAFFLVSLMVTNTFNSSLLGKRGCDCNLQTSFHPVSHTICIGTSASAGEPCPLSRCVLFVYLFKCTWCLQFVLNHNVSVYIIILLELNLFFICKKKRLLIKKKYI